VAHGVAPARGATGGGGGGGAVCGCGQPRSGESPVEAITTSYPAACAKSADDRHRLGPATPNLLIADERQTALKSQCRRSVELLEDMRARIENENGNG